MADQSRDPTTDALIREVDEELREEQFEKLWKQYGNLMIAVALSIVLGVAGYKIWQSTDINQRTTSGNQLSEALSLSREAKPINAIAALDSLSKDGAAGYPLLAKFHAAAIKVQNNDFAAAALQYWDIAKTANDPAYGELATLLAVMQDLNHPAPDFAKLKSSLNQLITDTGTWRFSARELSAAIALREGDGEQAYTVLQALAQDATAPAPLKARAQALVQALTVSLGK